MRKQPSSEYRGYRTAGIRLSEEVAPEVRTGREFGERASLYAFHMFDKAHLVMMSEEGIIDREKGAAMLRALREMEAEGIEDTRSAIGGGMHSGETYLIRRLGEEVGGWEHLARSSVDLGAVGGRLRERDQLLETAAGLVGLRRAVLRLAAEHVETVFPGYFHWQHAQPITLGHYFTALGEALERDSARTEECYARVNRSPAGAVVMTGSSFPLRRERTAELLGFDAVHLNTLDATHDQDHSLETLSLLGIIASHLSRLGEDLSFWSGRETAYVDIADRYASGSSILMQMKTPTPTNQVKGLAGMVTGALVTAHMAARTGTGMGTLDASYLRERLDAAFEETNRFLRLFPAVLATLTVDRERAKTQARRYFAGGTDLAGALVSERGLPWRTAHQICGILFRLCSERGITPDTLTPALLDEAAVEYFGEPVGLSHETIQRALDPAHFVEVRTLLGGPAPAETRRQIALLEEALAGDAAWLEERHNRLKAAATAMEAAIDRLLAG